MPTDVCKGADVAGHGPPWCWAQATDTPVGQPPQMTRPARALMRYGAEAQLLVVGSHGHGGFVGMLIGSTSQALVHHAPCPLAIVRPPKK